MTLRKSRLETKKSDPIGLCLPVSGAGISFDADQSDCQRMTKASSGAAIRPRR